MVLNSIHLNELVERICIPFSLECGTFNDKELYAISINRKR